MSLYLIPIVTLIGNQIVKLIIESIKGKFSWNHLLSNGGMPSSHSSFVSAAATVVGLASGFDSPLFALAVAMTLIVAWDAFTARYQIGYQGLIINKLIKELPDREEYKYPLLNERIGHSFSEVIVGIIFGTAMACLLYSL